MPIIIEHIVRNSHTQPAYDFTIKLYVNQLMLVISIKIRTNAVLLLPYATVDRTLAIPTRILLNPAHVKAEKIKNKALKIILIFTVLLFFSTIFVKIKFLVQPIIFIAVPVYAPRRKY